MKRTLLPTLLAIATWVAACGDEAAPASAAPTASKSRTAAAQATAPVQLAANQYLYSYSPVGKRDPFHAYREGGGALRILEDQPCNDPLCQFDLDSLKVVAVVSGDANPMAMLEDGSGIGHVVRRNSKVGKQGGKVTAIARDCLVVTSFVQGVDGKAQANRVNMCVKQDEKLKDPIDLLQGK